MNGAAFIRVGVEGGDGGGLLHLSLHRGAVIRQEHGDRLRLPFKSEEERYLTRRSSDLEYQTTTLFSAGVSVWMI